MKPEYDFSKGERGKKFSAQRRTSLADLSKPHVQTYLAERAAQKGLPLADMVNTLLKQEIELIESVK
jgi:hypothetical protein